jgi:hypothetical protein
MGLLAKGAVEGRGDVSQRVLHAGIVCIGCLHLQPEGQMGIIMDMIVLILLVPVFLSFLLLGAHFLRANDLVLVGVCLAAPLVLVFRRWWAARAVQVLLILGALEWVWTMYRIMEVRMAMGMPWGRMAMIMGGVALFTVGSAGVFLIRRVGRVYFRDHEQPDSSRRDRDGADRDLSPGALQPDPAGAGGGGGGCNS